MGLVAPYAAEDATIYPRGARVIVRTERGLETGEVLAAIDDSPSAEGAAGAILRGMMAEDDLLELRLRKNRDAALAACDERLARLDLAAALVDVEHLFDGQTIVFHFLGDPPREVDELLAELAELYDAKVQFRAFVEAATTGCGPDCGTEAAAGHGCSSCATGCAVAGACSTRRA